MARTLDLPTLPVVGPDAMHELGAALAAQLGPGDLVCLRGDLGAGKTTLVQGLALGLGLDPACVASPTFALVHTYQGGDVTLVHLDLYRLDSAAEAEAAGLTESLYDAEALVVVEWPDIVAPLLPPHAIWLELLADGSAMASGRLVRQVAAPRRLPTDPLP